MPVHAAARIVVWIASVAVSCASPRSPSAESVRTAKEIGSAYSVRVAFSFRQLDSHVSPEQIHASPPKAEDIDRYLRLLRAAISRLPTQLFRCGEIRGIALVSNLTVGGTRRYAVPAREERTLVLDVGDSSTPPEYLEWTFYHELFHLIDFSRDELIRHDREWESLNAAGFRYGPGGDRAYRDPETAHARAAPPPGFVSLYATMGAEEDKAETFAAMMTRAENRLAQLDSDGIVGEKRALLRSRLAALCPAAAGDWDA